ncbi:MAG: hypothetical protein WC565_06175 [Parcubacteria group bacterium]|jgi:uncharacterized protein GlcG (DUF336 family)
MSNILVTDIPAGQTLDMPCNNLLAARFQTATAASLTGNGGKIYQTLFVDAMNAPASGADGSLLRPFQTLQAAINYAVAQAWTAVELLIAPATYAAAVAVPDALAVTFQGWDNCQQAGQVILGGDITVVGGVGSNGIVGFSNVVITAATIATVNPATQDLWVSLHNTFCSAQIIGFNVTTESKQSTIGADVTANGGLTMRWDGASWAYTLQVAPALISAGALNHLYFDAGHDTYRANVAVNTAIGTTAFVDVNLTPWLSSVQDRVTLQMGNPAVMDLLIGVHGVTNPGIVKCWVTNLSRVSGIFDEDCLFLIHHEQMVAEPAP